MGTLLLDNKLEKGGEMLKEEWTILDLEAINPSLCSGKVFFSYSKTLTNADWDANVLEPNVDIVIDIMVDMASEVIKLLLW